MIKKFTDMINERFELMNFNEAFNVYILGQTAQSGYHIPPYGNHNLPSDERYYGDGIVFGNGYKYISHGGGCSGEDCNTTFIIDSNDKLIAKTNW